MCFYSCKSVRNVLQFRSTSSLCALQSTVFCAQYSISSVLLLHLHRLLSVALSLRRRSVANAFSHFCSHFGDVSDKVAAIVAALRVAVVTVVFVVIGDAPSSSEEQQQQQNRSIILTGKRAEPIFLFPLGNEQKKITFRICSRKSQLLLIFFLYNEDEVSVLDSADR